MLEVADMHSTCIGRKGVPGRDVQASSSWKGKRQYECRLNMLLLLVVALLAAASFNVCLAQSFNDAVTYLDNAEKEVVRVAAKATENFANTCGLVASCGKSCSRQSCEPLEGDLDLLTCKNVALNPTCIDSKGSPGCSQLRVTLSKSYVRVPTPPNVTLTTAANYTICSQRMLDPLFMEISNNNHAINLTSWFYLGSVEGVQRSFPGRDVSRTSCTFEPRKRPWYMGATAVTKDLVILLDSGNSMGGALPGDILTSRDITKFNAAVNIVKDLLDTLTYGDRVSVLSFSRKPDLVYKTMVANGMPSYLQPLKDELDSLSVNARQGVPNLLSGILRVNETYSRRPSSPVRKIMIVITDGQFADDSTLPAVSPVLQQLRTQNVLSLFYSFDRSDHAKAVLSSVACNVSGIYERIENTVQNPLWTLRSYFGIIAQWRLKAVAYRPYWIKPYRDSGSLEDVITVAYPVFAPDNYTLIGVVGSDVIINELGSIATTSFSSALVGRPTDDSISVTPEPLPCNVQLSTLNTCPTVVAPANPVCVSNDTSGVSVEERVCNCPPTCKAPQSSDSKASVSAAVIIGAASGGGALALLAAGFLVVYCFRRRSQARKIDNQVSVVATNASSSEKTLTAYFQGGKPLKGSTSGFSEPRPNSVVSDSSSRRRKSSKAAAWPVGNQSVGRDITCFTMEELEEATNNWSEEALLGKGACGSVYKGKLHGVIRAIKRPHPSEDVAKSTFDKELDLLSKLNHRCLVRLIGYCEDERVLVFEYMQNGTLEDCHHKYRLGRALSWKERLKIAAGASKGLEYLHEYATTMIIHGDVKPANILLDEKLEAHIADFGLSLSSHDQDASMLWASRMGGTPGYFDPEYASLGSFTPKSDVYSFGVALLEIFSGRKVVHERRNITSWAAEMYEQDVGLILDPSLEPSQRVDSIHAIIGLALQCVQTEHRYRPKMKDVAAKLSSAAADWNKFEWEASSTVRNHPSRRQHPQYRTLSHPSDGFEGELYVP